MAKTVKSLGGQKAKKDDGVKGGKIAPAAAAASTAVKGRKTFDSDDEAEAEEEEEEEDRKPGWPDREQSSMFGAG